MDIIAVLNIVDPEGRAYEILEGCPIEFGRPDSHRMGIDATLTVCNHIQMGHEEMMSRIEVVSPNMVVGRSGRRYIRGLRTIDITPYWLLSQFYGNIYAFQSASESGSESEAESEVELESESVN